MGVGNPAAALIIKKYLSAIRLEQSMSAVVPKHSRPMFVDKLVLVSRLISYKLRNPKLSVTQKYILQRDLTFFNMLAITGNRAGDLGSLWVDEIRQLPDAKGVIFALVKGKTVDIRDARVVVLFCSDVTEFCPVCLLNDFIQLCVKHNINLQGAYCFRSLVSTLSSVCVNNFSSSAANARLKFYLQRLHIFEGETPHSTRSACALTLLWLGIDTSKVKSQVGWKSDKMLQQYTNATDLCDKQLTTETLASADQSKSLLLMENINRYKNYRSFAKIYQ